MEQASGRGRRRHDRELKRQVLAECAEPGASVARVALAHGLNANLVHKWRRGARPADARVEPSGHVFVPVAVAPAAPAAAENMIHVELRRGALAIRVNWPVGACSECAVWMREILR